MRAWWTTLASICASGFIASAGCYQSEGPATDDREISVNIASPEVLLARLCTYVSNEPLCQSATQAAAFTRFLNTMRAIVPRPLFTNVEEFLAFVEGGSDRSDLYPMLASFLGADNVLLAWTPVTIPDDLRARIAAEFTATVL